MVSQSYLTGKKPGRRLDQQRTHLAVAMLYDHEIVPDINSILNAETAVPITDETLKYGQRVRTIAVGVPDIMTSEAALLQFSPPAFGLIPNLKN